MSHIWLQATIKFRYVTWAELKQGDEIYYTIKGMPSHCAKGPFKVVDPSIRKLENSGGVQLELGDNIQPLVIERA